MKKFIAAVLVIAMAAAMTMTASAGSFLSTVGNIFCTLGHTIETGAYAVANTAEYVFTDSSFDDAYSGTREAATKIKDSFLDTVDSAVQVGSDTVDTFVGIGKTVSSTVAAAGCGLFELGEDLITGSSDYKYTNTCYEMMKEGYRQADNGIVKDVAIVAGLVSGVGVPATLGIVATDMAKSGIEYMAGYINDDQMQQKLAENSITLFTAGAGAAANSLGGVVAKTITTTVTNAGCKIANDLLNDNDKRSAYDIVVEDISKSVGSTTFNTGVGTAGAAVFGK